MKIKFIACVLVLISMTSCGDYAALEAIEVNKKTADSLFRADQGEIDLGFKGSCDSMYKIHYHRAIDSIKQLRIEGIKGLIDPQENK